MKISKKTHMNKEAHVKRWEYKPFFRFSTKKSYVIFSPFLSFSHVLTYPLNEPESQSHYGKHFFFQMACDLPKKQLRRI
jgi:hypothetical protein